MGRPERFLLGDPELPDPSTLSQHHLSAYAYTKLPSNHVRRPALRAAFLQATSRHMSVKAKLLPLVRAWCVSGVESLIFKGFYLAEFVYPIPSQRFYGDVDVIIKPEHATAARKIAKDLGWLEAWSREESLYRHNHEEARLDIPGFIRLEMHRYILDSHHPLDTLQRRFTQAAWEASHEVAWEDTSIRVLQPADSILIGLVLNRSWSAGDGWVLKPHDILDFENIVAKFGLSQEALEARARELNCARTLALFLKRCNQWEKRFDLKEPSFWQRQAWNLAVTPERGHLGLEHALVSLSMSPAIARDIARYWPELRRVRQLLRSGYSLSNILEELDAYPGTIVQRSLREEEQIARGVKWGTNLLWPRGDNCLARSLALFAAYRKRGYPAVFFQGSKGEGDTRQEHAWVDLAGRRLADLLDLENCEVNSITLRYPPAAPAPDTVEV